MGIYIASSLFLPVLVVDTHVQCTLSSCDVESGQSFSRVYGVGVAKARTHPHSLDQVCPHKFPSQAQSSESARLVYSILACIVCHVHASSYLLGTFKGMV